MRADNTVVILRDIEGNTLLSSGRRRCQLCIEHGPSADFVVSRIAASIRNVAQICLYAYPPRRIVSCGQLEMLGSHERGLLEIPWARVIIALILGPASILKADALYHSLTSMEVRRRGATDVLSDPRGEEENEFLRRRLLCISGYIHVIPNVDPATTCWSNAKLGTSHLRPGALDPKFPTRLSATVFPISKGALSQ
ncbi:hypothetical protein K474DRAFT_1660520 [Panus rudis PR-1116 ss-1]|nr:hypothetical protein K474DRAFT_1660520 [Panus rudis PR-1116 ss-1]